MASTQVVDPVDAFISFHASTITSSIGSSLDPSQDAGETATNRLLYELRAKLNMYHYITNSDKDVILQSLEKLAQVEATGTDFRVLKTIEVGKACDWIETTNDVLGLARYEEGKEVREDKETPKKMLWLINKLPISSDILKQRVDKLITMFGIEDPTPPPPPPVPEEETEKILTINPHEEIDIYRDHPIYCQTRGLAKDITTIIWKGVIKSSGVEVAIKLYKSKDEAKVKKFENEGKILQRLNGKHSTFLDYYGMFYESTVEGGQNYHNLYLVMELCEGSLMDEISSRALSQQYYVLDGSYYKIFLDLLEGFTFLESSKIYHQDIKPHNIFISKSKQYKIADFNISTFTEAPEETWMTTSSQILQGTDGYMAPELQAAMDEMKSNPSAPKNVKYKRGKADSYSLGLTFLQIWTLQPIVGFNKWYDQNAIDQYLNNFQPPNVANMLKGMLKVDYKKRFSIKKAMATFNVLQVATEFAD